MNKLIALIILTTSILVTAKEVEVIKFDNNQSPEINKETLIKELKNQFGEFDSSCMTRNLGWSPKLSESFLSALRKSGATIPPRTGFDTSKYGIKYDIPYGCIGLLESKMHFVLEKHFKYYCEASKKGDIKESSKYINNIVNNTYEDFVFSCGIDSNKNSLAYLDAKDWYNQWTTGFNLWSEFMAKNANSKYTNIIAKRKADKEAKLVKQKTAKLKKEKQIAEQKKADSKAKKLAIEKTRKLQDEQLAKQKLIDTESVINHKTKKDKLVLKNSNHTSGSQLTDMEMHKIEEEYQYAIGFNTVYFLNKFLKIHPDTKYTNDIILRIESIRSGDDESAYRLALSSNQVLALRQFIKKFQNSKYVPEARKELIKLSKKIKHSEQIKQEMKKAKYSEQHEQEMKKNRIAKKNMIKDIRSGKSKLSTCDPAVFDSGYGIGLLYSPPINADNKSYVFHRMNIYNKYNDSQILYRYTNTDKMLLVNITPKTYLYHGEGYWQLTTCIIGTVTDIKHINGVTIAVLDADYIGKSLDGY